MGTEKKIKGKEWGLSVISMNTALHSLFLCKMVNINEFKIGTTFSSNCTSLDCAVAGLKVCLWF
jgi:hypothetical protein